MRPPRPTSVSLLSWFLIVGAVLQCMIIDWTRQNPGTWGFFENSLWSVQTQLLISFGAAGLTGLCGVLFFRGINAARYLFVGLMAGQYGLVLWGRPWHWMQLSGLLILAGMLYILFRPRANAFFRKDEPDLRGLYWSGH